MLIEKDSRGRTFNWTPLPTCYVSIPRGVPFCRIASLTAYGHARAVVPLIALASHLLVTKPKLYRSRTVVGMFKYPNRREVLIGTASIAAAAALPVPVIAPAAAAVELPLPRHVEAIRAHAAHAGLKLISEFYDSNGRVKKWQPRERLPEAQMPAAEGLAR